MTFTDSFQLRYLGVVSLGSIYYSGSHCHSHRRCSLLPVGSAGLQPGREGPRRVSVLSYQQLLHRYRRRRRLFLRRRRRVHRLPPSLSLPAWIAGISAKRPPQASGVIYVYNSTIIIVLENLTFLCKPSV